LIYKKFFAVLALRLQWPEKMGWAQRAGTNEAAWSAFMANCAKKATKGDSNTPGQTLRIPRHEERSGETLSNKSGPVCASSLSTGTAIKHRAFLPGFVEESLQECAVDDHDEVV
jgi:hypothetical protein